MRRKRSSQLTSGKVKFNFDVQMLNALIHYTQCEYVARTDLFNLYKTICVHFPQPRELTKTRKKKITKRLNEQPTKEFWEIVFKNAEKSVFIRQNHFFSFDWVLENDKNALKVFEGNYNKNEIKEDSATSNQNGGKYSKCYG